MRVDEAAWHPNTQWARSYSDFVTLLALRVCSGSPWGDKKLPLEGTGHGMSSWKAKQIGGAVMWQWGCKRVCVPWQGQAFPALTALSLPFPHAAVPKIAKTLWFWCLLGMNENLQSLAVPEGTLGAGDVPQPGTSGLVIPPRWHPGAVHPPNRALPLAMAPKHHRHSFGGKCPPFLAVCSLGMLGSCSRSCMGQWEVGTWRVKG